MKNFYILFLIVLSTSYTYSQLLAEQGFEDTAPAAPWTYTATPEAYNIGTGDIWKPYEAMSSITPLSGSLFWGIRDIDNSSQSGEHKLSFSAIDVTGQTSVVVSFNYYTRSYDSTDSMEYELFVDGVSQGKTPLEKNTNAWIKIELTIPNGSSSVSLNLTATQNGGSDYGAWDDVKIEAGVVAQPSLAVAASNLDYKNGAIEGEDAIFSLAINNFTFSSSTTAGDGDGYITWSFSDSTKGSASFEQFNSSDLTITAPAPGSYSIVVNLVDNNGQLILSATEDFWVTKMFTLPFTNDFDYGTVAGSLRATGGNEWSIYSGTSNAADYATTSLSMANYGPSGNGGSVVWEGASGYDYDLRFSPVDTGAVYASMLVSITSSGLDDPDYVLGFRDAWGWSGGPSSKMNTRVFVKKNADESITFGLREADDSTLFANSNHQLNTTYLLVIKYDFTNSSSSLYVLDAHTPSEPTPDVTTDDTEYSAAKINSFFIRQSSTGDNDVIMDGLSISQTWNESLSIFSNYEKNILMYPNPTEDYLNFIGLDRFNNIKIIDLTGKVVLEEPFSSKLDVQNLNKGLYLIEVSNETSTKIFKIIKN